MVVTNNLKIADGVRMLRQHGSKTTYYYSVPGFNSRLDALQAAILRVKFKYLDNWSSLRRQAASTYNHLLSEVNGIKTPNLDQHLTTSANYYTVRLDNKTIDRNNLRKYLATKDIDTAIYYPLSLHLQEAYKDLGYKLGDFPESELAQEQVLSFPMYPEIGRQRVIEVVSKIKELVKK
jgi:dTDP-4-amino-4,6-dideoxygalactose transaminase